MPFDFYPRGNGNDPLNGMEFIGAPSEAFTVHCYDGKSFDDLKKTRVDIGKAKGIHFGVDFKFNQEAFKKMQKFGDRIQSNQCFFQHNLVNYGFSYLVTVIEQKQDGELCCKVSLAPVTYTYGHPTERVKGGVPVTFKPKAPELKDAKWIIKNGEEFDLLKDNDGYYSTDHVFTISTFDNYEDVMTRGEDGLGLLRFEMTIEKDYFDIGKYINLSLNEVYVTPNSFTILNKILLGENVSQSDWIISASEGFPRDFHVHGPVLADASHVLRAAITKHQSVGNEIAMISHENRFIISSLKSEDMHVILTYIYHRRFVLPDFKALARTGKILTLLFPNEILKFFGSWNADLINHLKRLDRSSTTKTITECVKALVCVTSAPIGALFAVYNVALIVGADAIQMAEAKGKTVKIEKIKQAIGEIPIDHHLELIDDFKIAVGGPEKVEYIA